MKTFGDTRIDLQLDEQRRSETTMHNEKVKKNREILKRLIHCVIFLGKQELPFRGHDESRESANRGNYLELLTFLAKYDPDLHYHLSTSKVFIGTSSQIQNDLISAVAEVMGEIIKEEISKAPFVALMLDETSDVSNAAQLSFVLRFVTDSGVKERFVKFEDVTGKKRAEDVAALALGFLEEHGCMDKLVAQCYDGAAVMASGLNGVQAKSFTIDRAQREALSWEEPPERGSLLGGAPRERLSPGRSPQREALSWEEPQRGSLLESPREALSWRSPREALSWEEPPEPRERLSPGRSPQREALSWEEPPEPRERLSPGRSPQREALSWED
ncbi:hypothetical protein NHX12_010561 [Muraenolepis orangiensis]|uniref:DUF4371 domain-containing protein n=1 Tax=Muraenolepis orangiensis TaxID=630683 RepID=A0A9Q0DJU9_9TELE|nr:hypothetical protein NHX12_010561 [Muraenolepis orangiensis]